MIHRRNLSPDVLDSGFVANRHEHTKSSALGVEILKREGSGKLLQGATPERVFAWPAIVQKVCRRKETSDGLHPTANSIDLILRLRIPIVAGGALHQGKMAAG